MSRFHIHPATGEVKECTAQPGNCPFGDLEVHFENKKSAEEYADRLNELEASGFYENIKLSSYYSPTNADDSATYLSEEQIQYLPTADLVVISKQTLLPELKEKYKKLNINVNEVQDEINKLNILEKEKITTEFLKKFCDKLKGPYEEWMNKPKNKIFKNVPCSWIEGEMSVDLEVEFEEKNSMGYFTGYKIAKIINAPYKSERDKEYDSLYILSSKWSKDKERAKFLQDAKDYIKRKESGVTFKQFVQHHLYQDLDKIKENRADLEKSIREPRKLLYQIDEQEKIQNLVKEELEKRREKAKLIAN